MLTSAMRNRLRKQKAGRQKKTMSDDAPLFFTCCDFGMLFGDASHYDPIIEDTERKVIYQQKKKDQAELEERLRKFKMRKKLSVHNIESIEVVEDV